MKQSTDPSSGIQILGKYASGDEYTDGMLHDIHNAEADDDNEDYIDDDWHLPSALATTNANKNYIVNTDKNTIHKSHSLSHDTFNKIKKKGGNIPELLLEINRKRYFVHFFPSL